MNIEELLKTKFAGVRSDVLAQVAAMVAMIATTDDEIGAAVGKLTQAQVEAFGKGYRKAVDAEVSSGTKTFEENLRKRYNLVEKGQETQQQPPMDEAVRKFLEDQKKASDEKIAGLTEQLKALQGKNLHDARRAKFDSVVGGCKDENAKAIYGQQFEFIKDIDDTSFDSHMETLKGSVEKTNQLFAERSLPTPPMANTNHFDESKVSADLKEYVERMNGKTE